MMKPTLLIVDDDEEIRAQLKWGLTDIYDIVQAADRRTALEKFRLHRPLVIMLDLGLPPNSNGPEEGLAALSEILEEAPLTKVVIASGQNERSNTLSAIGAGAYDFLPKPVEIEELKILLKRCFNVAHLEREFIQYKQQVQGDAFEGMLGTSEPMQALFDSIRKIANTQVSVMILGESGTGKEMAARAIHQRSDRSTGPFVAINCSAIPENLLESELFGHEKGSFTGAHAQHVGKIEQSQGGTLFLDEIGEVPLQTQVKLLRFLQEGTIERVGGRQTISVDSRILAATNADLKKGMANDTFREDFYYRLSVVELNLPALRDRGDDIHLVARALLQRFGSDNNKPGLSFSKRALSAISHHSWPGNVRELQNRIRRAVVMCEGVTISPTDLELADQNSGPFPVKTLKAAKEDLEREMVEAAMKRNLGNITTAASELGISRPTLYEFLERYGIGR